MEAKKREAGWKRRGSGRKENEEKERGKKLEGRGGNAAKVVGERKEKVRSKTLE